MKLLLIECRFLNPNRWFAIGFNFDRRNFSTSFDNTASGETASINKLFGGLRGFEINNNSVNFLVSFSVVGQLSSHSWCPLRTNLLVYTNFCFFWRNWGILSTVSRDHQKSYYYLIDIIVEIAVFHIEHLQEIYEWSLNSATHFLKHNSLTKKTI